MRKRGEAAQPALSTADRAGLGWEDDELVTTDGVIGEADTAPATPSAAGGGADVEGGERDSMGMGMGRDGDGDGDGGEEKGGDGKAPGAPAASAAAASAAAARRVVVAVGARYGAAKAWVEDVRFRGTAWLMGKGESVADAQMGFMDRLTFCIRRRMPTEKLPPRVRRACGREQVVAHRLAFAAVGAVMTVAVALALWLVVSVVVRYRGLAMYHLGVAPSAREAMERDIPLWQVLEAMPEGTTWSTPAATVVALVEAERARRFEFAASPVGVGGDRCGVDLKLSPPGDTEAVRAWDELSLRVQRNSLTAEMGWGPARAATIVTSPLRLSGVVPLGCVPGADGRGLQSVGVANLAQAAGRLLSARIPCVSAVNLGWNASVVLARVPSATGEGGGAMEVVVAVSPVFHRSSSLFVSDTVVVKGLDMSCVRPPGGAVKRSTEFATAGEVTYLDARRGGEEASLSVSGRTALMLQHCIRALEKNPCA